MFYVLKRWIQQGSSVLLLFGVVLCDVPTANGEMVLLPDNRIIAGTIAEIAADQVKVYTAEVMPRYLSAKQAQEKGIWPLHKGDHLHIVVNEQNMVLGYHLVGDMGSHQIIHGQLAQPLMVGQEWAVIKPEGKNEQIYRVRALVRSKLAAVPIGFAAVFLIDETNQIMDTAFGSDEALRAAAKGWQGSSPKGVNRQLTGTIVKAVANGEVTIRTEDGRDLTKDVRHFLRDKVETLSVGDNVILLLDDNDKIADVAFRQ
jgi:translation initiation factor IF-1